MLLISLNAAFDALQYVISLISPDFIDVVTCAKWL